MEAKEFFEHYDNSSHKSINSTLAKHVHAYLRSKTDNHQFNMDDVEQVLSMLVADGAEAYHMLPTLREVSLHDLYLAHRSEINNSIINEVVDFPDPDSRGEATTERGYDFNMYDVITQITQESFDWSAKSMYAYWGYVKQAIANGKEWRL